MRALGAGFCRLIGYAQLAGCSAGSDTALAVERSAVVYGADDRLELVDIPANSAVPRLARSVAAVIPRGAVRSSEDGHLEIHADTLQKRFNLCEDVPFFNQISAADCTAALVDGSLMITAGHCFRHALDCRNYLFVFGYARDAAGNMMIEPDDVYECTRTYVQENDLQDVPMLRDYAIVELTRQVTARRPIVVRDTPAESGERVIVIGAFSGAPLKVTRDARIVLTRSETLDYFLVDADLSIGASGSPVLDERGQLLGVAVRGNDDYERDDEHGCLQENRLAAPSIVDPLRDPDAYPGGLDGVLYAEAASYGQRAVDALCARGYPSLRLCGAEVVCGDSHCGGEEDAQNCPSDCALERAIWFAEPPGDIANEPSLNEPATTSSSDMADVPHASAGCALTQRSDGSKLIAILTALMVSARSLCGRASERRTKREKP